MSSVSAAPAAPAAAPPRTAAVRRALVTAVFLGGLLGLAFLLGGPAHAAGTDALRQTGGGAASPADGRHLTGVPGGPAERTPAERVVGERAGSGTDQGGAAVGERDGGRGAGGVTGAHRTAPATPGAVAERARHTAGSLRGHLRGLGTLGGLDDLVGGIRGIGSGDGAGDGIGGIGGIGDAIGGHLPGPGLLDPGVPGTLLPVDDIPGGGVPGDGAESPGGEGASDPERHGTGPSTGRPGPDAPAGPAGAGTAPALSPGAAGAAPGHGPGTDGGDHRRDGTPGHLPGAPYGTTAPSAGDGSGPRCDQHAALTTSAPRFGLPAGAVRAADGAPTRERSADILEFPG
ncbi:hypothetical protein [Streptomyces zingiberis]|uniref:Uncharacterized protein n=1 Tax=Streptomyces zingiberis TaxID=2053010 RepID=A0ABX1BYV2_9ACTN|nr:hypothetical protein [Streptomyces zingiberis]NJQ00687.1 hypothetical protein [Streptomyces zingiberis]